MKQISNNRGSITEFTVVVPMVISLALVVLQLMLLLTQRAQNHAVADRIAFLAATVDRSAADLEAQKFMTNFPTITGIEITNNLDSVKVRLKATTELLLPIPKVSYQIEAIAVKER